MLSTCGGGTMIASILFVSSFSGISASNSPNSIKNKRICRSCSELAKEVDKKMEETAANPRVIQVASRIGADGRPIPGRKIDYMTSDARYFDVFDDELCDVKVGHSSKSACYLIKNDYEEELKEWFKSDSAQSGNSFLESFCFKVLPECDKDVVEASMTDIETENYEDDKDKIDDDFMPEAKEENLLEDEKNFTKEAVEKVKDFRDNFLDLFETFDEGARQFLLKVLLENDKIRPHLNKFLKQEHFDIFLNYWYLSFLSLLLSVLFPVLFVVSLRKKAKEIKIASKRKSVKRVSKSSAKSSEESIQQQSNSESEAAEADDETDKLIKSTKKSSSSPIKRASKRNSKSQAEN